MPVRKAEVKWMGPRDGYGEVSLGSGAAPPLRYTFATRFEEEPGSNPEELLAGSLAACFTMALVGRLTRNEVPPKWVETSAEATIEKVEGEWTITRIGLKLSADVPGLSAADLKTHAEAAKAGCPVSRALGAVKVDLVMEG